MVKLTCPRPTSRGIWHSLGIKPQSRNSHPTSNNITPRTHLIDPRTHTEHRDMEQLCKNDNHFTRLFCDLFILNELLSMTVLPSLRNTYEGALRY